jgi:hypothetical protein
MDSAPAPIALFAYQRPDHTKQVLDSLLRNAEAPETDLIVFVDGPRQETYRPLTEAVGQVFEGLSGFKSVTVNRSPINLGLSNSITQGVTAVVEQFGKVVVVEDDIVVSRYFLEYMNTGLELYQRDENVASIHGYRYPVSKSLPATYFLRGADCWGWATWARAWAAYQSNGAELLASLLSSGEVSDFDFAGSAGYTRMLQGQIEGKNDSWAVRWYASAFLSGMLTLYPGESLVRNIGMDGSGEHCGKSEAFDSNLSDDPVQLLRIEVAESPDARALFTEYFRSSGVHKVASLPRKTLAGLARIMRGGSRSEVRAVFGR